MLVESHLNRYSKAQVDVDFISSLKLKMFPPSIKYVDSDLSLFRIESSPTKQAVPAPEVRRCWCKLAVERRYYLTHSFASFFFVQIISKLVLLTIFQNNSHKNWNIIRQKSEKLLEEDSI